jgi:hypothetical protein
MTDHPDLALVLNGADYALHMAPAGVDLVTGGAFYWRQPFDRRAFDIAQSAAAFPPDGEDLIELREYLLTRCAAALRRIDDRASLHVLLRDDGDAPEQLFEVVWAFATAADLEAFLAGI